MSQTDSETTDPSTDDETPFDIACRFNEDDQKAIVARLKLVADALGIPDDEITRAAESDQGLIEFGWRHGQSLDWLLWGDVRGMIARLSEGKIRPWPPSGRA